MAVELRVVGALSAEVLGTVTAEAGHTVLDAKVLIEEELGTPKYSQRLLAPSSGRLLSDDELISDISTEEGSEVSLLRADPCWCKLFEDLGSGRTELEDVDVSWRGDRDLVLAAVKADGCALEFANRALRADREVVLEAVRESGSALRHALEEFQGDREVVLTAVQRFGPALEHATPPLQGDREVVLTAARRDLAALAHAGPELKASREFALTLVQSNGAALRYLSEEMKQDRAVVLAAVKDHPSALLWANPELHRDQEFILSAVRANGLALRYASMEMRQNTQVVLVATGQNKQALWYGAPELKHQEPFMRAVQELLQHMKEADAEPDPERGALVQRLCSDLAGAGDGVDVSTNAGWLPNSLGLAVTMFTDAARAGNPADGHGPSDRPSLEYVSLAESDLECLFEELHRAEGLESFTVLSCENLTVATWARILASIPSSVQVINAQQCNWGDAGAEALGRLIGEGAFPELVTLWLLSNQVGDAGARALGNGIGMGRCLRLREIWIFDDFSEASKAFIKECAPDCEDLGLTDEEIARQ